jgi:hypothetical protein
VCPSFARHGRWFLTSPLIGQEFPVQCHHDPVAGRVGYAFDIEAEADGAHDAVAELFVDEFLDGRSVELEYLLEPVDRGVRWHRGFQRTAGGLKLQCLPDIVIEIQQ